MMTFLRRIWGALGECLGIRPKPYETRFTEDVPDKLAAETVYVVGENGNHWCITMLCPCNCGSVIQLNLLPQIRPCWAFSYKRGWITISPSIWCKRGCRSHFFVRKGHVDWCVDTIRARDGGR